MTRQETAILHDLHEYLTLAPRADSEIPAGHVVVHNHVIPAQHLGDRGFRAWTQTPTDRTVPCDCGWAPEVETHYRILELSP